MIKSLRAFALVFLSFGILLPGDFLMANSQSGKNGMTQEAYRKALIAQNKIHGFIRAASQYEKAGQHEFALENYLKAYEINQCAGLVAVCRGAIADNYEALGEYYKALEYVEISLQKLSVNMQQASYKERIETKLRLLKKIEEQKEWESKKNSAVSGVKDAFPKASIEDQKKFLEGLGGKGVWDVFKDALVAEHSGDFKKAREIYEQLLPQKEAIEKEMGLAGWVMLYPAIQRTSELLGDKMREKESLVWINPNLLQSSGQYHQYLSKLTPAVQNRLKERVADYQI